MIVRIIDVHVNRDSIDEFKRISVRNREGSIGEPGILRFDVLQDDSEPQHFVLYEVYRDEAAAKAHKDTAHYKRWRDSVADWMAEPRRGVKYDGLLPADESGW